MTIMLGLGLYAGGQAADTGAAVPAPVSTIATDGWQATAITPATAAGGVFTVRRAGFDAAGNGFAPSDTITITTRVRQPYPNQNTLTPDSVALSDFIYAGDTVPGVTNNSTRPAPKPIAMWLVRDKLICKDSAFTARLAVAHAHARGGRPVAAVRFRATDGATTVEALVNTMATTTYAASGLTVPHFAGALDLTGFANGATIIIDAVIYPWVGAAFTISTDADAYPSPNLTTLRVLCDRTGAYGTAYAYVDATLGTSGGVVSATPATAAAAPFQTVVQAATAIRAFNNSTFGRNFTDGGVIRLVAGTHTMASAIRTVGVTSYWPLTIEAANPANRATTIFQDRGSSLIGSLPNQIVIKDLTLRRSGAGSFVFLDNGAGSLAYTNLMSIENCVFDANGASPVYNGWVYTTGVGYLINCDQIGNCGQSGITGTVNKTLKLIGSVGDILTGATCFGAIGCRATGGVEVPAATAGKVASRGPLFGWNHMWTTGSTGRIVNVTAAVDDAGVAVVGNVIEQAGADTGPAVFFAADGHNAPVANAVFQCCTVVGSRTNWLYQDNGSTTYAKWGSMRFVVQDYRNTKSDVFGANANLTGNWPAIHNVGSRGNCARRGANDAAGIGTGNWLGEVAGLGDVYGSTAAPVAAIWTNDRSGYGSGGGNGDYTPGAGNALPVIPAGLAPYPVDQRGRAISDAGGARAGAIQPG